MWLSRNATSWEKRTRAMLTPWTCPGVPSSDSAAPPRKVLLVISMLREPLISTSRWCAPTSVPTELNATRSSVTFSRPSSISRVRVAGLAASAEVMRTGASTEERWSRRSSA